jgi:hypothetical protein
MALTCLRVTSRHHAERIATTRCLLCRRHWTKSRTMVPDRLNIPSRCCGLRVAKSPCFPGNSNFQNTGHRSTTQARMQIPRHFGGLANSTTPMTIRNLRFWMPEPGPLSCWAGSWRSACDHKCGDDGPEESRRSKHRVGCCRCAPYRESSCYASGECRQGAWQKGLSLRPMDGGPTCHAGGAKRDRPTAPGDHPAQWSASLPPSSGLTPRDGLRNDAPVSPVVPTRCIVMGWTTQGAHRAFHCRPRTPQGLLPHPGVNFSKSEKSGRPG